MKRFLKYYFPRYIEIFRAIRFELRKYKSPFKTKWNFLFVGNKTMSSGDFEHAETLLVRKLLKEIDVLINVGANIGYYCCHALNLGKHVIAFEPMPNNLYFLYKNLKLNNWKNIEVFPVALSKRNGLTEIYGDSTGASLIKGWANIEPSFNTSIPTFIFDSLVVKKVKDKKTLIIIDIEGSEYDMLLGANEMLKMKLAPIWIVEIIYNKLQPKGQSVNPNFSKTFDLFFSNGYEAFDIENEMLPITKEMIKKVEKGELVIDSNNYLFKKVDR